MKLKITVFMIMLCISGLAQAQYVAQTLQQRIDNDNNSIALDHQDIDAKNADIQNIVNDQTATAVTSQVADVQIIQANQNNLGVAQNNNVNN